MSEIEELRKKAKNGDAEAAFQLGKAYAFSKECIELNLYRSLYWLKLASNGGHSIAKEVIKDVTERNGKYNLFIHYHFQWLKFIAVGVIKPVLVKYLKRANKLVRMNPAVSIAIGIILMIIMVMGGCWLDHSIRQREFRRQLEAEKEVEMQKRREAKAQALKAANEREQAKKDAIRKNTRTFILPGGEPIEMIYVAPGSFLMGDRLTNERRKEEHPIRRVRLTRGYWLGKYEITQAQWYSVMRNNISHFEGKNLPVECISYLQCQEFITSIRKYSAFSGARLPTSAEWEYACRAGADGEDYAGEKAGVKLSDVCWFKENSSEKTHPVGMKRENDWGFFDMHGNVAEWCNDVRWEFRSNPVSDLPVEDPTGDPPKLESLNDRIVRGGHWEEGYKFMCYSGYPDSIEENKRSKHIGFRLCISAE